MLNKKILLPSHLKIAKHLYSLGYSVVNAQIYVNNNGGKSFITPKTKNISYEDCEQFIGSKINIEIKGVLKQITTNCIMLLTGIRTGIRADMKHVIAIDLDNPKENELNGVDLFNDEIFQDNCYSESTPSGGRHFIFHLDPLNKKHQNIVDGRLKIDNKVYSIDIFGNTGSTVCIAPSKATGKNKIVEYTTIQNWDKITTISDDIYNNFNITNKEVEKPLKAPIKNVKSEIKHDLSMKINDSNITTLVKIGLKHEIFRKVKSDYSSWFKIACLVKNSLGDTGIELFNEISLQMPNYESFDAVKLKYESLDVVEDGLKIGSLVQIYKESDLNLYKVINNEFKKVIKTTSKNTIQKTNSTDSTILLLTGDFCDVDIADYLYEVKGDNFIYYGDYIYSWNGVYWTRDTTDDEICNVISRFLFNKLKISANNKWNYENCTNDDYKIYLTVSKRLNKLRNNTSKKGIIEEFKLLIKKKIDIFDLNPDLIGFKNGVYDLKEMKFREGLREDHISLIIDYDFREVEEDEMEELNNFIDKVLPIKEEQDFILKALSSCIGGRTLENLLICTGEGRNGKDTLISYLLKETIGRDFFYYQSNTVLTGNNSSGVNQEKANMDKKRCVLCSEPNKDCNLKNNTIKELTGGKQINARGLYSKNTETILHSTSIVLCNDIPTLDNVDNAISKRLIVAPFRSLFLTTDEINKLPKDTQNVFEVNSYYKEAEFLTNNKLTFFHLLLQHYKIFQSEGYVLKNIPKSITKLSDAYLSESDDFLNWFNERYTKTGNNKDYIRMIDVYDDFRMSDLYSNFTKKEKRCMNRKKLNDIVSKNPNLRLLFKERLRNGGLDVVNVILSYNRNNEDNFDDED